MESAKDIWERALGELQIQVSKANYTTWLRDSQGISCQDNLFSVGVPNTFIAEWLSKRFSPLARKTLIEIIGRNVDIQFVVHQGEGVIPSPIASIQNDGGTSTKTRTNTFNPKYTFDNFIVGNCNRLACTAALETVRNPGKDYNPLFIYSDAGQGKTHLLHAIGHEAVHNGLRVAYTSGEQFTSEFVSAVRQKQVEHFRSKFRDIHMFLFDDIQFINDKKQTLQSFLNTFNELHNNGCQIVITAECSPKDMTLLSNRMKSRFEGGLVASLQAPDFETCLLILKAKVGAKMTTELDQALRLIAERIYESVRQVEGTLAYLIAQVKLAGTTLTPQTVHRLLTSPSNKPGKSTLQLVANYFNLSVEDLIGKKRDRTAALARQVAMYLLREHSSYSFVEIGKTLGNRSHATALHGYKKIASELAINPTLCEQVLEIRGKIK